MPSENIITRANGAADFGVGEVVHVTADRQVARAQADLAANLSGAIGLAQGWTVVFDGVHPVVLEAGLLPVAGQTLYVSPTQPGRATNIQPSLPALTRGFATVLDASRYANEGTVACVMSDAPGGVVPSGAEGFLSEVVTNAAGSPLVVGEVVRISANDSVTRSQANALPSVQGTVGVVLQAAAFPGTVPIVTEGKSIALLEAGLLGVVAGQTLYVSPNVAGRATNVKPTAPNFALCIGVIKDATGVSSPTGPNDTVVTDIDVDCEPEAAGGGGTLAYAEFVQQLQNFNVSRAPGDAIEYTANSPFIFDTIGILTAPFVGPSGPGSPGTAFLLPAGTYIVDYENSADAAWSLAIYKGPALVGPFAIDVNTIVGASTATTWLHGRAIVVSAPGGAAFIISPVTGTHAIPLAGTAAGAFIARLTILKIA